jgi:hypothetical protein
MTTADELKSECVIANQKTNKTIGNAKPACDCLEEDGQLVIG